MKKILLTLIAILTLTTALNAGTVKKSFKCANFTTLSATHSFDITLIKSDVYKVLVEIDDEYSKYLSVTVQGGKLELTLKDLPRRLSHLSGKTVLKATVQMPSLSALYLSGACKLHTSEYFESDAQYFVAKISGACSVDKLDIKGLNADVYLSGASVMDIKANVASIDIQTSGASKVNAEVVADDIECDVSGASKADITMDCSEASFDFGGASSGNLLGIVSKELSIEVSGASSVDAIDLKAADVEVDASGASKATVWVTRSLDVECSGASTCKYKAEGSINVISDISKGSSFKKIK